MPAVIAVFVGPAGSGKTSLVKTYSEWARSRLLLRVAPVNLDPGAEKLEYEPVFDVRSLFTLSSVMEKYGLGPNGAFIKASELIAEKTTDILSKPPFSEAWKWDMILVDTPGQMEAFLFRPSSSVFFRELSTLGNTVIVYLIDASAVERATDALFLWFLYVLLHVKVGLTVVPVVNKRDVAKNPGLIKLLVENPERLVEEAREEGLAQEIVPDLVKIAMKTRGALRAVLVSAMEPESMEQLHVLLHEAFCACGDLT